MWPSSIVTLVVAETDEPIVLEVGDDGFWDQLYDEEVQPMPYYQFPGYALPAYGNLQPCLKYSPEIRRMLCVPPGTAMIHKDASGAEAITIISWLIVRGGDRPALLAPEQNGP